MYWKQSKGSQRVSRGHKWHPREYDFQEKARGIRAVRPVSRIQGRGGGSPEEGTSQERGLGQERGALTEEQWTPHEEPWRERRDQRCHSVCSQPASHDDHPGKRSWETEYGHQADGREVECGEELKVCWNSGPLASQNKPTALTRKGFPGGANGKEPTCQCRRHKRLGSIPRLGRSPWRRAWQPTPGFLPGESHGQRS